MILIITKFIILTILIFLEFIIYSLPIYTLGLITNLIITLIWYFPSIYQFYSFIFTTKEYNLRAKIYLLLFSPIIIILYIPFFITYFIMYGIFISLINPLITITKRPEYPIYSLSLIAAIVNLICKYISGGCSTEEILIDSLLLEKIKDIIHFTKRYWHFHYVKYPEKIKKSTKSYIGKLIFLSIIHISNFLDFFIILPIFIMIIIPYIIVSVLILANYVAIITSFDVRYVRYNHYNKFCYIIFIMSIPITFLLTLIMINSYGVVWEFRTILELFYKIFDFYKNNNNGLYDVLNLFWVIIISPFLKFEDFFYVYFKINLRYKQEFCEFYPW